MFINKYNKYKKKYLKLKNQFAGTKTLEYELFEVKIHCILIKEDCREAYLMYNMIYMTECFNYIEREFSDLEIFDATLCLRKEEKKSDDESDDESDESSEDEKIKKKVSNHDLPPSLLLKSRVI